MLVQTQTGDEPKQRREDRRQGFRARLLRRPELEPVERLGIRLQSRERNGHEIIVGALNLSRTDGREVKARRIEHRRFFADRHHADDEVALKRQFPHVTEQMRFARSEAAPNEGSLRLTLHFQAVGAPGKGIEEGIDQSAIVLAEQPDSGPVGNPGAESFDRAARRKLRKLIHYTCSTIDCDLDSIRTRAARGLSRSVETTSSNTRAFSAS